MWSCVANKCSGSKSAPCARAKHSATLLGGYVYVLGGRGAGGALPLRDFWRYAIMSGRWERLEMCGEPPPALQEHTAIAHEHKLYVFGGEAASSFSETPLWIYDTETNIWRKLPGKDKPFSNGRRRGLRAERSTRPKGRRGHSAHGLRDCLLVYGGYEDMRGSSDELWAFHYETETWQRVRTTTAGPARHRHAAAVYETRLYVHGGQCDLRACSELWQYDTITRVWSTIRPATKVCPRPRSGHVGLRAGAHLYIFGGEVNGQLSDELWRFHFATETWEQMRHGGSWPSPRLDSCAILVPGAPPRFTPMTPLTGFAAPRPDPPANLLKEISKFSTFHIRRSTRCSYSVLAVERDSTESLVRQDISAISKSRSAYVMDERQPADGGENPIVLDEMEHHRDISREPISVPDFADMILPTPVLSPVEASKLVYLDSEEEEDMKKQIGSFKRHGDRREENKFDLSKTVTTLPKSASVRFSKDCVTLTTTEDEGESSTSDYASAEKVNRLSGNSMGFCNPHYLGPDVRKLGATLTPDSGVGPGDIEMQDLREKRAKSVPRNGQTPLHILLIGGKEPPHVALLQSPLSLWAYQFL